MQDELNSVEENAILDMTVSLKMNNKTLLTFEKTTPLGVAKSFQLDIDEDYAERKLYLDLMTSNLGTEVLIKRYEFFLENMAELAGKTFSIHTNINEYHVFFLTVIEGELTEEVNYTKLIYQFDRVQIPSKNNKEVIEIQQGATVFERGFVVSGRVTPGNTRIISTCDSCGKSFLFRMYHVGFSEVDYYYCNRCTNYLAVSLMDRKYNQLLEKLLVKRVATFSPRYEFSDEEIRLNLENYEMIEQQFIPCSCGGRFEYLANCLCPYCNTPYIDFFNDLFRKADHYYVVEMVEPKAESFYGESTWKGYKE